MTLYHETCLKPQQQNPADLELKTKNMRLSANTYRAESFNSTRGEKFKWGLLDEAEYEEESRPEVYIGG